MVVAVRWIVVERHQVPDMGELGERERVWEGAVTPPDVGFVFGRVVLRVVDQEVDPVDELIKLKDTWWWFVDTAGIRRRAKEASGHEYYASLRTRAALDKAEDVYSPAELAPAGGAGAVRLERDQSH